jgi:hypothetical protein
LKVNRRFGGKFRLHLQGRRIRQTRYQFVNVFLYDSYISVNQNRITADFSYFLNRYGQVDKAAVLKLVWCDELQMLLPRRRDVLRPVTELETTIITEQLVDTRPTPKVIVLT